MDVVESQRVEPGALEHVRGDGGVTERERVRARW
jgi:hypothetical protein